MTTQIDNYSQARGVPKGNGRSFLRRGLAKLLSPYLYGCTQHEWTCSRRSYSQFGEDLLLADILRDVNVGFYVDVGGYDPVYLSNTYGFYSRGWSGLVVDANPEVIERLRSARPLDVVVHAAVGTVAGQVNLMTFDNGAFASVSPDPSIVPEEFRVYPRSYTVEQLPLQTILERHVAGRQIDLLSVDCEGVDLDVLRSNDWERFAPTVVAVEDHADVYQSSDITRFMAGHGYRLHSRAIITSIFSR